MVFHVLSTSLVDFSLTLSSVLKFTLSGQFKFSFQFLDSAAFRAFVVAIASGQTVLCLILTQELTS